MGILYCVSLTLSHFKFTAENAEFTEEIGKFSF